MLSLKYTWTKFKEDMYKKGHPAENNEVVCVGKFIFNKDHTVKVWGTGKDITVGSLDYKDMKRLVSLVYKI